MRTLLLIAAALFCVPLWADMGPKPRTTAPGLQFHKGDLEDIPVEMTAEEVDLVLSKGDGGDNLSVTATFHMTNLGEDTGFEVGFPIGTHKNMTGFKVTTDGVEHEIKLIDRKPAKEGDDAESRMMHVHDYWYVWDASYKAGAKVTHVVSYNVNVWHHASNRNTGYILQSGAGWKNAIGKAVVTLKFGDGLSPDHLRNIGPKRDFEFKDGVFTWTFNDLEPTAGDNIVISYDNRTTFADEVAQLRAEKNKHWDSKQALVYALSRGHHRLGREKMNEAELNEYVEALAAILEEMTEEDDKITMPGKTDEKIRVSEDMDEAMRKMIEAMGKDRPRSYTYGHGLGTFFANFGRTLEVATEHPDHKLARETLDKWVKLGQAFLDDKFYIDDEKLAVRSKGDKKAAADKVRDYLKKAEELPAATKTE